MYWMWYWRKFREGIYVQAMQGFQEQWKDKVMAQEVWSGKESNFKNTVRDTLFRYLESTTQSVNGLRGLP